MPKIALMICLLYCSDVGAFDIIKVSPLKFPEQVAGITQDVEVTTSEEGAAVFNLANGEPGSTFTLSIVEERVELSGGSYAITVDSLKVTGPAMFDGSGNAYGVRVGAKAHIGAEAGSGMYYGSATLLIVQD